MYVSPELMNEEQWRVLGTATRWATENWRDLEPTRMIGGDPRQGQPYGFAHWLGEHGIIALRNPHYQAQTMRLALDQTEGCRAEPGAGFAAREIYPAHRPLPDELTAGGRNEVTLAPCSVTVIELRPQANWPTSAPTAAVVPPELSGLVAPASLTGDHRGEHIVAVSLPAVDVPHQRLDLYLIIRGPGANHVPVSARINGAEAQPRPAEGPGWLIRSWDLRPLLGQPIDCTARLGGLGDRPFMNPSVEVEAWLVGEAGERSESDPFAGEHLPWAIAQGCTAYSTPLLPAAAVARTDLPTITADDLAGIRAAKLRLEVFGANPQPQYAGKQILINGAAVAELPANTGTLDAWQEKIIDLPAEHLGLLRLDNTLMLTNVGGDSYKARGLALAVQRADGIWVTTDFSDRVLCSAQGWLHAEGELFEGDRSAEVELTLP